MISIRPATQEDSANIIGFQQRMALETENVKLETTVLAEGLKRLFDEPSKGKYYVAEDNGEVIGCLMTTFEWSEWRCGNVLWIQSVYIKPSHRSKGVFKKMYEHIKSMVTPESEYRGIRLYVDKTNAAAQKVYEKLGMNGEHYQVYEWMAK
jgi:ribosomal protein S18 acetylase RimI-like enzyme